MHTSELMQNILNSNSNYTVLSLLYGPGAKGQAYDICLINNKSDGIKSVFCFGYYPDDGWRAFCGRDIIDAGNLKELFDSLSKYVKSNPYIPCCASESVATYNLINEVLKRDDLYIQTDAYFVSSEEYRMIGGEVTVGDETTDIFYGTYNDHKRGFERPVQEPHTKARQTVPLNVTEGMAALIEYHLCAIVINREREKRAKPQAENNWLKQFVLPVNGK